MASPSVWFFKNDMLAQLTLLRSSTMASSAYLNSSTGVTVTVWKNPTTVASTNRVVNARNLPYLAASQGGYRGKIESTEHGMLMGTVGLAIFTVRHAGLDGEWRVPFRLEARQTT